MKKHNIFLTIILWIYGQFIAASIYCSRPNAWAAAQMVFKKTPDDHSIWNQKRRAIALQIWIQKCDGRYSLLRELPAADIAGMEVAIPAALARLEIITDIKTVWQIWRDTTGVVKENAYQHWQKLIDEKILLLPYNDLAAAQQLLRICPPESPQHERVQRIIEGGSTMDVVLARLTGTREQQQRRFQKFQRKNGNRQLKRAA